jgi:hypothetical protein
LKGNAELLKQVSFTSFIAQPQEKIGLYFSSKVFFHQITQSQLSAITLWAVKNKKSQFSFFTSTLK